jgi:hypothetical protein
VFFIGLAVCGGLDYEQVIVAEPLSGIEGASETACGARGKE